VLSNAIRLSKGFKLYICVCDSVKGRDEILRRLWHEHRYRKVQISDISEPLFDQVSDRARYGMTPIMVLGLEQFVDGDPAQLAAFQNLNISRPMWPDRFPRPIIFWVTQEAEVLLSRYAPDFYRFRSATIDFAISSPESERTAELHRRIAGIDASPKTMFRWKWELWRLNGNPAMLTDAVHLSLRFGIEIPSQGRERVVGLVLSGDDINDHNIGRLRVFPRLGTLMLFQTPVTDAGLVTLQHLPALRDLTIIGSQLTDLGLRNISFVERLNNIEIWSFASEKMAITDRGLGHLQSLAGIRGLGFWGASIRGDGLALLRKPEQLVQLRLDGCEVTDGNMVNLKDMIALSHLSLAGNRIDGTGLECVAGASQLETLSLLGTDVQDESLVHLRHLGALQQLSLRYTPITDLAVGYLKSLVSLKRLDIAGTKVTAGGVSELQRALPNCKTTY
jgi:Leucine-rich repeat (LRR) protein